MYNDYKIGDYDVGMALIQNGRRLDIAYSDGDELKLGRDYDERRDKFVVLRFAEKYGLKK